MTDLDSLSRPGDTNTEQLSPDDIQRFRARRRRYLLTRQTAIFGWILLIMTLTVLVSLPFATGLITLPFGSTFSLSEEAKAKVPPCSPSGAPAPLKDIRVNVYNASSQNGLAKETAKRLKSFGVKISAVANAQDSYAGSVRLTTGKSGVKKAFSLARLLPDADVRLDLSLKDTVSVLLGEQFEGALSKESMGERPLGKIPRVDKDCQIIN